MFRILIGLFFLSHYCLSQDNSQPFNTLLPVGEAPKVLVENWDALYLQGAVYHKSSKGKLKKGNFSAIHKELYNSGMLVFGDPISIFTKSIVDRIRTVAPNQLPSEIAIFTIKSKTPVVYLDDNKSLMVSTGLFSQLSSPEQLAFFICKAVAHKARNDKQQLSKQQLNKMDAIANKLYAIRTYSAKAEIAGDLDATKLMKSAGYSLKNVQYNIDLMRYADQPFEDVYVPTNYFNTPLFFIPTWFFDVNKTIQTPSVTAMGVGVVDSIFQVRYNQLKKLGEGGSELTPENERIDFNTARKLARLETIRLQVIDGNCQQALYSILIMEKEAPEQLPYLSRMKMHAWLGFVEQGVQTLPRKVAPNVDYMLSESQRFYKVLRRFTTQSRMAYALRLVADLKANASDPNEYQIIQNRLLDIYATSKLFQKVYFADYTFEEFIKKAKEVTTDKYEKIDQARSGNPTIMLDTTQFYLFGLSDYMKDEKLKLRLQPGAIQFSYDIPKNGNSVVCINPVASVFKRKFKVSREMNQLPKSENFENLSKSTSLPLKLTFDGSEIYSKTNYIDRIYTSSIYSQLYEANNYLSNVVLVDMNYIKSLKEKIGQSTVLLSRNYNTKHFKWEGHYLLCLLVVPAPFIIPEMVLKRNKTWMNTLVLNTEKGTIDFSDCRVVREPLTKQMLKAYSYTGLMNYKKGAIK